MTVIVKHNKTNTITDWTQAQLDEQIGLGNFPPGTTLANIVLPSDWNNDHTLTGLGTMAEQDATAVAITGGTINNTTIGATTATTGKFTSVTTPSVTATTTDLTLSAISTGKVKFNTLGGLQAQVLDSSSAVNYVQLTGGATNVPVSMTSQGSDADIGFRISSFGAAAVRLFTNNLATEQARVSHTASAVNFVQVTGSSTGNTPAISAQGSDSNINLLLNPKGTGQLNVFINNGSQFRVSNTASAVNYLEAKGNTSSNAPQFSAQGSDTNISMAFQPKGTGAIDLAAGSSGVNISNGSTVTNISRTAQGSGYTTLTGLIWTASAPTTTGGSTATGTVTSLGGVSVSSIASGGTGYTVGNVLTVVGGTFSSATSIRVDTVSSGVITAATLTNGGTYTVIPSNPASVTGGSGTGATFNISYGVLGLSIGTAGSGYVEQPTITFSGGGGSGASAFASIGALTTVKSLHTEMQFLTPGGIGFEVQTYGAGTSTSRFATFASSSGNPAVMEARGASTNIDTVYSTKGTGVIRFNTNSFSLGSGVEQMRVAHTASAVNYVQVTGSATGAAASALGGLSFTGSDASPNFAIGTKGTGYIAFYGQAATNVQSFRISNTNASSAGNLLQVQGAAAGSAPSISAISGTSGTDTNIDLNLTTKGTGAVNLNTGNGTAFKASQTYLTGTAVNYFDASGRQTGLGPIFSVNGSDADVRMNITAKGTGSIGFYTNLANTLQMQITPTASAVNYVQVTGAVTTGQPTISAQGSDTNVSLSLASKGTGIINLQQATNLGRSSTNWLQVAGSGTGLAPSITSVGGDTDIDLALTPKGTGLVRFGTYVAGALLATGYINIKAADGTTYKVLVST